MTLSSVGCEQKNSEVLRFGLASLPTNLDPLYATDATSTRIDRLLFQRLVHFDDAKKPIPGIADWQKLSDKHYRFKLNNNTAKFHNQQKLTSEDVKATYEFILDSKNASPHRTSLKVINAIETLDDNTIDFKLNRADPLFPAYLAIDIVPKNLLEKKHNFSFQPIGSGPFKFVSKTEDGRINLVRQKDQLKLSFIYVPDPTVRVLKLLRGELDLIQNDIQPELLMHLAKQDNIIIDKVPGSNFSYIGFNLQDEVLKQKAVRQAIAYGINRNEIIQYVFNNSAKNAQAILPPEHWAGNSRLKALQYQPELAKQILTKMGYTASTPLHLTFKTSSDPFRLRLASIYQYQLAKIGIQLKIRSYDWGTFFGDIKAGRFQLYSLAWVGINTPDIFRYTFHSQSIPPQGANRGRFIDEYTDRLIETAETQQDLQKQAGHYAELQAHLLQELPYIPLWYEDHVVVKNLKVRNYHVSSSGNYDGLINVEM